MIKSNRINFRFISFVVFLIVILFPGKIYSIPEKNKIPSEVIVGGELLQINMKTNKLMVYVEDDNHKKLKKFDLVESVEGNVIERLYGKNKINNVSRKSIFEIVSNMSKYETINLKVIREEDSLNIPVNKLDINPSYFIEEIPFCASLTYIDPIDNSFGAVGHNIKFSQKENMINNLGDIYLCRLCEVRKSSSNQVGSIYGEKILGIQGNINKVNEFGAKGKITNNENIKNKEVYEVGRKEDVRNGSAQILIKSDNNETKKAYEIDITKIKNQDKPQTQSFEFEVKDEELIKDYGGIVQGMSGCPIIQNGKIIGAVSHVIVSNPKCGIGIYIEWMMEG